MDRSIRRFSCTQCGRCCDHSPEVELSEAADLADVFVFRLLFRLHRQSAAPQKGALESTVAFYQKKRLLNAHAARIYENRGYGDQGKSSRRLNYLMISALPVPTTVGVCSALDSARCRIYDRRPLTCRTVPFHYARAEAVAKDDLEAFVRTPGYRCDTSEQAPVVLELGKILDSGFNEARSQALRVATRDRPWKQAIVRAMRKSSDGSLPRLNEIESNAAIAAMTTSMRVAWEIAVSEGLLSRVELTRLIQAQLVTIERELERGVADQEGRNTLLEMKAEYRAALPA